AAGKIKDLWTEKFRPSAYSPEEKKRSRESSLFANHVLRELNQRNLSENWKDEEFAELEAEGRKRSRFVILDAFRTQSGLRREPSLSKALERSAERLILLEGVGSLFAASARAARGHAAAPPSSVMNPRRFN